MKVVFHSNVMPYYCIDMIVHTVMYTPYVQGRVYDVDVDPGTQYCVSLEAVDEDGVTSSEIVHFESVPDSKSCVYV